MEIKIMFKKIVFGILFASFCICAFAQSWNPPGPIQIVVPYTPGGSTDKWARVVSRIFSDRGWENYVDNKPGADTTIGSNLVANAVPDGRTLYLSGIGFLDANIAFKTQPEGIRYTEQSFTDIVPLGSGTLVLAVANNVPVNNYQEFKEYVKKHPKEFNLGFFNQYIANAFFLWARKENLPAPTMIMYKGSSPLDADLLGGQIPFAFDTYNTIQPLQAAKKVKVIAVLDSVGYNLIKQAQPDTNLFNISKVYPELSIPIPYGLAGPAGLSKEAVYEINRVINAALKDPKYTKEMSDMWISVRGGTPGDQTKSHTDLLKLFRTVAKEIE